MRQSASPTPPGHPGLEALAPANAKPGLGRLAVTAGVVVALPVGLAFLQPNVAAGQDDTLAMCSRVYDPEACRCALAASRASDLPDAFGLPDTGLQVATTSTQWADGDRAAALHARIARTLQLVHMVQACMAQGDRSPLD
jgi:hypothetical protein